MVHRRLVYIYLLIVPSFSSRYFNKIKRKSRLGNLLYHCRFQLISIVIHIQAILDFQNNLYFKETQQTNAMIACHL